VVAAASALVVLALTCPRAPLTRLLSVRPAVYLGRVSYALYLIQLTPLGSGLLFHVLPGREGVALPVLYLGMTAVSALLFELVEEPGRVTLLALWKRRSLDAARTRLAGNASLAILLAALCAQHALWAVETLP